MELIHEHLVGNLSRTELHDLSLSIQTNIYIYCYNMLKQKLFYLLLLYYVKLYATMDPMNGINREYIMPIMENLKSW